MYKQTNLKTPPDEYPDHIYLDGNLYNNTFQSPTGSMQYIPAEIYRNRDSPIVYNPSYYNLAVARFSITANDLARVEQPLLTQATGPAATTLWVGLSYDGVYYDEPVILETIRQPSTLKLAKITYNVNGFLDIINRAWRAAETAAQAAGAPTGTGHIVMTYDNQNELYNVNVPAYYGTGGVGVTGAGIGVHMSFLLYQKFQSFNIIQNAPLLYNNHDITFVREWTGNNYSTDIFLDVNTSGIGTTGTYMVLKQESSWASSIMDAHRLIITTSSLPTYSEYVDVTNYQQFGGGNGNATLAIISDFLIGHDSEFEARGENFLYVPEFLRLVTLTGSSPITQWDIKLYVARSDGSIYPLYIPPGGEVSIKLLFLKKGLES